MVDQIEIGYLLFPNLTQLDLTGPYEVLKSLDGAKQHLIWKQAGPVRSDSGLSILADTTFDTCPPLDVICIPGGPGQIDVMEDDEALRFVHRMGSACRYVTSVCTGSLILGAAGLLKGYRATSHWTAVDLLAHYGAIPVRERVVVDRNRVTGGGVTSGIDFGLTFMAEIAGEHAARYAQLGIEYDPKPPFDSGSPDRVPAELVDEYKERTQSRIIKRRQQAEKAGEGL